MLRKFTAVSLLLSVGAAMAGCSGSNRPAVAPVHGQVTYQGRPVVGATVEFLCPGASRPAGGTTDAAGNYRLTTFDASDGAIIGDHIVTVNVYASQPESSLPPPVDKGNKATSKAIEEAERQSAREIEKTKKAKPVIPPKYGHRRTSDLHKEVVAGDNVINIELKD